MRGGQIEMGKRKENKKEKGEPVKKKGLRKRRQPENPEVEIPLLPGKKNRSAKDEEKQDVGGRKASLQTMERE